MCISRLRAVAVFAALLLAAGAARGERFQSEDSATNVIVGTVKSVNARWGLGFDALGSYVFRYYEAAVDVEAADKGTGVQPGQTVSVRYWRKSWVPLSPAIILGLTLVGLRFLARIQRIWVRWTLKSVLLLVALFLALLTAPLPGTYGHHDFPEEGQRIRAYLVRDPAGAYDALYPHWAKVMPNPGNEV